MQKQQTGQLVGSLYETVGISKGATTDRFVKAAHDYRSIAQHSDCPAITDAVALEALRIASNLGTRAQYDRSLTEGTGWPIALPLRVSIGTPGLSPLVNTKFCDVCLRFPAVDLTIPLPVPSSSAFVGNAGAGHRFHRGASPYFMRRCRQCGPKEILFSLKVARFVLMLLVVVLAIAMYFGADGVIRFRILPKPQTVTRLNS
jgi:hypothetical protein